MSLLTIKNLTLSYDDAEVIKRANFEIKAGEFVCVVGANGSGKSTLIKAILGFLKPKSGKVIFSDDLKRTAIGYLPQESKIDPRFPATVFEIVLSGTINSLKPRPFYRSENYARALKAMKSLHIDNLKSKSFGELSGGQKQKVLLARALSATETLLILDEPSNNLDSSSRQEFYSILKKLNDEGLTIIMITHDIDVEDLIGGRILALENSSVSSWTTSDYLRRFK